MADLREQQEVVFQLLPSLKPAWVLGALESALIRVPLDLKVFIIWGSSIRR